MLGINETNAEALRSALLNAAATADAIIDGSSPYGTKYEIQFEMTGSRGAYTILSIWIVLNDDERPRLVTAFVE